MREILFRGKRVDNGEWVEGFVTDDNLGKTDRYYIIGKSVKTSQINQDTLGQFTGRCDKNGKKIFEGDIVNWYGEILIVKFGEYDEVQQSYEIGNHFRNVEQFGWFGERQNRCSKGVDLILLKAGEVIGNIYGNPELLEGV